MELVHLVSRYGPVVEGRGVVKKRIVPNRAKVALDRVQVVVDGT